MSAGQLWLKRKKLGAVGDFYDSKPARRVFAETLLGKSELKAADIRHMCLSPADVAYVEIAVSRGLSCWLHASGRAHLPCLPCAACRPAPPSAAQPRPDQPCPAPPSGAQPSSNPPRPAPPIPPLHTRAQVEHYLNNSLAVPMPRINDATFKRAYKERIEAVRSRSSPHIEWEPME